MSNMKTGHIYSVKFRSKSSINRCLKAFKVAIYKDFASHWQTEIEKCVFSGGRLRLFLSLKTNFVYENYLVLFSTLGRQISMTITSKNCETWRASVK
jgi:hypothetical protein